MAENAQKPEDKYSWLKLARSWLDMIAKDKPATTSESESQHEWPKPRDDDSQASH